MLEKLWSYRLCTTSVWLFSWLCMPFVGHACHNQIFSNCEFLFFSPSVYLTLPFGQYICWQLSPQSTEPSPPIDKHTEEHTKHLSRTAVCVRERKKKREAITINILSYRSTQTPSSYSFLLLSSSHNNILYIPSQWLLSTSTFHSIFYYKSNFILCWYHLFRRLQLSYHNKKNMASLDRYYVLVMCFFPCKRTPRYIWSKRQDNIHLPTVFFVFWCLSVMTCYDLLS